MEQALVTIIDIFYKPLKAVMHPDDYEVIFGNIEEINNLHKALLADLKYPVEVALGITESVPRPTSLDDCPPQTIGEVFVKWVGNFPWKMENKTFSGIETNSSLMEDTAAASQTVESCALRC